MSEKILDSKIQIPIRIKNFIARDELLEMLKLSTEKVVVLNAGSGFGKTTLLVSYAVETQDKCAWYHLSSLDNDIMTFIKYLSCALNKVLHEFKFSYDNHENRAGNELIETIAIEFAISLSQFPEENISILLDDFQEINNEEIFNFISILINNTGANIRFFMTTKAAFPKFLARYLLQGSAVVLNDRKLAFNKEEILSILMDINTINDSVQFADYILDYTEGWPAGVMAIALALRNERKNLDKDEMISLCKESKVYDYFMYEIFKKLPFDIQNFLVHTSVLNILSPGLCNAVMNTTTAKSTLDYLVQENIFIVMLSGKGNVYRYHSIFKDYLSNQLSKNVEMEILKKAALYCLNKGDYEQAAEYAISCNDVELMQSAFELVGKQMISIGETLTLSRWIEFLNNSNATLTAKTKKILSNYYHLKKDLPKAYELMEDACSDFATENNENEYLDSMLQKIGYLEEKHELFQCIKEADAMLAFIKRKYSANWYVASEKKMVLSLLLYNEAEAADMAEEILMGNTIYIRGGKEAIVNEIKRNAALISLTAKAHLKEEQLPVEEFDSKSSIVNNYSIWCKVHSYYRNNEDEKAYSIASPYLSLPLINDVFTAYIKLIGCIILKHQGRDQEASSHMSGVKKYNSQYQFELPAIRKEDEDIVRDKEKPSGSKKDTSKIIIKCFENGITYVDVQSQEIKWRTKKTYEMFAYLVDKQGKAISKDIMISVLWPDTPLDKAVTLFHTTLSYLRKSLTEYNFGDILQNKGNGYALDIDSVETDYALLMNIYEKVQAEHFDEIDELEKLMDIYKSSYFENISSDWVINKREHLERVFIICCKSISEELMKRERYMESVAILSKAARLDPYSEEILMLIMQAYSGLGDVKSVKSYYEDTKRILKEELDTELSGEVEKLYSELIHRKK